MVIQDLKRKYPEAVVQLRVPGHEAAAIGRLPEARQQRAQRRHQSAPRARLRRSIMRQMKGVKISCIASSILPPGTTMMLGRDM